MSSNPYRQILIGLIFVLLDINIGGFDLILPDFIGYILVMRGLGSLSNEHAAFRKAWYLAIATAILSLGTFFNMRIDMGTRLEFRSQLKSLVRHDLRALVPQQVNGASLNHVSREDPLPDRYTADMGEVRKYAWATYSNGTQLFLLDYGSLEAALSAMTEQAERNYGFTYFGTASDIQTSSGRISSGKVNVSQYILKRAGDQGALLLWLRGKSWWNPWSWFNPGFLGGDGRLSIVEGSFKSVQAFESYLRRRDENLKPRFMVSPFVFLVVPAAFLHLLLIWYLSSGILETAMIHGKERLAKLAKRRRRIYVTVTLIGWLFPLLLFFSRHFVMHPRLAVFGVTIGAVVHFLILLLILGLVRKAGIDLPVKQS